MAKISCIFFLVSGCFLLHVTQAVPRRDYYKDADIEAYLEDSSDFDDGEDNEWAEVDGHHTRQHPIYPSQSCDECLSRCPPLEIEKMRYCCRIYCHVNICNTPGVVNDKWCLKNYIA